MLKIIPFNLLLIFLVVVVTGTGTQAIFNQNVLAQNSGEDGSRGLNFDSLFGSSKEGFSFDELFPFGDSSTSGSQDESAATDPLGGIDLVFPFNDIQSPKAQSDTPSEDASSTSPDDSSKSIAPQNESASDDEKALRRTGFVCSRCHAFNRPQTT